jgi:CheY-like chemotaxis protein/nucleoside phosphorylase
MKLSGLERKILREAITGAYPNQDDLTILLAERMDILLSHISLPGRDYQSTIFNLIIQLEAQGKLQELISALLEEKPYSPYLQDIKYLQAIKQDVTNQSDYSNVPTNKTITSPIKILIVEDYTIAAEALEQLLITIGYTVVGKVVNKQEAVHKTEQLQPDLVLMDIRLREDNYGGIEAATKIQNKFNIPVIYLSAYNDPETLRRLPRDYPIHFLVKPPTAEQLQATIEIALQQNIKKPYPAKILIVEDDSIIAEEIGEELTTIGYTVVGKAESKQKAVELTEQLKPDLILMDIKLQEGRYAGIEAAKQIQSKFNIPIIYLTVHWDSETLNRLPRNYPPHYLVKLPTTKQLQTTIEIALQEQISNDIPVSNDLSEYKLDEQPWYKQPIPDLRNITTQEKEQWTKKTDIVIITATDVELLAVLRYLKPLPPKRKVAKLFEERETYYLGKFGAFGAVVTKCRMGAMGEGSAILATENALRLWQPKAVIMVGIAFGKDSSKQKIADVLIASQVIPYESQRVGEEIIYRSPIPPSNTTLLNRFDNVQGWNFPRPDGSLCERRIGPILSGEKLVDSPEFKTKLFQTFPDAIGGEMEGAGVYAAAARANKPWILVKSICDWADGNKNSQHQPLAAASAVSLVHHILSQPNVLHGL